MRVIFNNPELPEPLANELAEIARAKILTAFNKSERAAKAAFDRHSDIASPNDQADLVLNEVLNHLSDIIRTTRKTPNPRLRPKIEFDNTL